MTKKPIYRAGMIGVGRRDHGHARGYQGNPRTQVVAAADPDPDNLEIFLERFPVKGSALHSYDTPPGSAATSP